MTRSAQIQPALGSSRNDELFTVEEAAEYLSTGERFVRRLVAERRISDVKIGKLVRLQRSALDAFTDDGRIPSE